MSIEENGSKYARVIRWININTDLSNVVTLEEAEKVVQERIAQMSQGTPSSGNGLRAALRSEQLRQSLQEVVNRNIQRIEQQRLEDERTREEFESLTSLPSPTGEETRNEGV
ncbi:MAG: hypothetical protein E6L03_09945 [Thaumarchaeota archaeon]|nr:MAG: hypothetical protein E6L03_09945 [Nitrososphaerota archaeon]